MEFLVFYYSGGVNFAGKYEIRDIKYETGSAAPETMQISISGERLQKRSHGYLLTLESRVFAGDGMFSD